MRHIIGEHKNQTEFLPDKHGKPIYVGSHVMTEKGEPRIVIGLNESISSHYAKGAVHVKYVGSTRESWANSDYYEVV